jgi:hypothetical protein
LGGSASRRELPRTQAVDGAHEERLYDAYMDGTERPVESGCLADRESEPRDRQHTTALMQDMALLPHLQQNGWPLFCRRAGHR